MSSLDAILAEQDATWHPDLLARLSTRREPEPHLSASSLTQFLRCPEQWRRVRIQGERERPGGALVWGSADHAAHERNFRQKIDSGSDITESDLKLAFADEFDIAVQRNGGSAEIDWGNDKPGDTKDRGVELAAAYHRLVSPRLQPLAVEERFEVRVPGLPVTVLGYVDLRAVVANALHDDLGVGVATERSGRRLIERKTSGKRVAEPKPDWRLQGLLYQAVEATPIDWHVSVKTIRPAVYTPSEQPELTLPYSQIAVDTAQAMVANAGRALAAYYNTFGPDEPWPGAVTYGWACGFCGFRPSCAWWRYERSAA